MKDQLSDEQIATYQEQGFLVIENFLDPEELQHWQCTTVEAVEERLNAAAAAKHGGLTDLTTTLHNQADPDNFYARVFTQALFKPPFGNPTGWHLDNPYWSFSSRQAISIWVALDDATLGNGCMWYLPGTHQTARFDNAGIGPNMADLFKVYPEWRTIEPVACPCPAGSAVFHNGLVAHGAGANMTNRPRRAMTCAYMPDASTFNGTRNILPEAYFQTLKVGDLLNNNEVNPLIWHK